MSKHSVQSKDPFCNTTSPKFDRTQCRLSTWRALIKLFDEGEVRAIGVSNYNETHLQEIIDAGLPLPALTQNPFHLYRSISQESYITFCRTHNITFLGYSPLGVPDWHKFPPPMHANQLEHPLIVSLAKKYGASPAQVLLNWQLQLGIPVNPRSQNIEHMKENLSFNSFTLTAAEVNTLDGQPQDWCSVDPVYECAPDK